MLEISALEKKFGGNKILHDINLTMPKGMVAAILGASGCGKTTLLRLIAGFLQPCGGEIRLDKTLLASAQHNLRPEQRGIGYVAQEGALFPHLTVAQNISFGLKRSERRNIERVEALLTMVGLPRDYHARAPQALSGGEQQRVALARALAPEPKLVLLDEPFSALDAGLRTETRLAVAKALKAVNATVILVTHDQDEALSMGQMVGVMQQNQLVQWAEPETLYRCPASPQVAHFVGAAVFVPAIAYGKRAECALGTLALLPSFASHGAVRLMIRPEQIRLYRDTQGIKAKIMETTYYGRDAAVTLRLCQGDALMLTARVPGYERPDVGDEVGISIEGPVAAYPADL